MKYLRNTAEKVNAICLRRIGAGQINSNGTSLFENSQFVTVRIMFFLKE